MSHAWLDKKKGTRWMKENRPLAYRVGNRFKRHVRTKSNPRGRIIRPEKCTYCPRRAGELFDSGLITEIQGCHLDYAHPFAVLWLCQGCHRKLERGTLRWRKRDVHDYSSLVNTRPARWLNEVPF